MLDLRVTASFDDFEETDDIALHIGVRIFDRVAHAGLRAQVHHPLKLMGAEHSLHRIAIRQVSLDELEALIGL